LIPGVGTVEVVVVLTGEVVKMIPGVLLIIFEVVLTLGIVEVVGFIPGKTMLENKELTCHISTTELILIQF
jgi:hypothetical protein